MAAVATGVEGVAAEGVEVEIVTAGEGATAVVEEEEDEGEIVVEVRSSCLPDCSCDDVRMCLIAAESILLLICVYLATHNPCIFNLSPLLSAFSTRQIL